MEALKEKAVRGGFVKIWAQAATFVIRIGSLMILARILDPRDFGLVGMVTAVTGVFDIFKDAGLSIVTVQRPDITDEQVSTLFWMNVGVGAFLAILALALSPILARFYHEPRLLWITIAMASGFLINAIGVQHGAMLQRQMKFTTLAAIDVASWLLSVAVGVGMALAHFGYWSLVGMTLTLTATYSACVWLKASWIPGRPRRGVGASSMLRFGGTVTLNSLVVYIGYNAEKVLLGRFWGAEALGIYGRAYQLVNVPTRNLNSAIGSVAYAALSRLQEDPPRFKSYFLKGYSLFLAVTVPITVGCALYADDFIDVVLGPKWAGASILVRLLAPTILAFALIDPFAWVLISAGKVVRSLKIAFLITPLVIAAYCAGLAHGPKGVALGYSIMMCLLIVPVIAWAKRGTLITFKDVWAAARPSLVSGLAAAVAGLIAVSVVLRHLPALGRFVLEILTVVGVYAAMLLVVMRQKAFYMDLLRDLWKRSRTEPWPG